MRATNSCSWRKIVLVLLGIATLATKAEAHRQETQDPVLHWNAIALQAIADDHSGTWATTPAGQPAPEQGGPTGASRALAIVHIAIQDSVGALQPEYESYIPLEIPWPDRSPKTLQAAVARAAHDTLSALYPAQRTVFAHELRRVRRSLPLIYRLYGEWVGATAAANILAARASDGSDGPMPYTPGSSPGDHRPDPLHPEQGFLGPGWGMIATFAGIDVTHADFRAPPPPPLHSAAYAEAYAEVMRLGGDGKLTVSERTPEQTEIGTFWAYDGTIGLGVPPRLYNQVVRRIAEKQRNSVTDNARLFALVNVAMADAGIAAWESKYHYNLWRPIVAIRLGEADGNELTAGDPAWTPLGSPASNMSGTDFTPPFPAYPSGHAAFGGAVFRMLALFYERDDVAFSFVSDEMNGRTTDWAGYVRPRSKRRFESFSEAMEENARSRIYLGIHWNFDATAGNRQGAAVADFVYATLFGENEQAHCRRKPWKCR